MERGKVFDCPRYSSLSDGEVPLINEETETKRIVSSFFRKEEHHLARMKRLCGGIIMCFVVSCLNTVTISISIIAAVVGVQHFQST
jgi:hypothetical protein